MDWKSITNFIWRNSSWIAVLILSLVLPAFIVKITSPEIKAGLLAVTSEALALGLSAMAKKVYTKQNYDKDPARHYVILGCIFIGVHIQVAITTAGVYWLEYLNKVALP